jgi:hypothetical protein
MFDAYMVARSDFEEDMLRKCFVIESLMDGLRLHEMDFERVNKNASMDSYLKNLLRVKPPADIYEVVKTFLSRILKGLKPGEMRFMEDFFKTGRFDIESLDAGGVLNPLLYSHPLIQWQKQRHKMERRD